MDISKLNSTALSKLSFYLSEDKGVQLYLHDNIRPVSQNGPQCGIVALAMSLNYFGKQVTVDELLVQAKDMKYTNNGEMFSANYISSLSNYFSPNSATVAKFPTSFEICNSLLANQQFIIPYDCDKNFGPACLNGHKAHWVLICGFFFEDDNVIGVNQLNRDADFSQFDIYLIGYQGKSRSFGIYKYEDLKKSNSQLMEAGPIRGNGEYVIDDPCDLNGIRDKVVIMNC